MLKDKEWWPVLIIRLRQPRRILISTELTFFSKASWNTLVKMPLLQKATRLFVSIRVPWFFYQFLDDPPQKGRNNLFILLLSVFFEQLHVAHPILHYEHILQESGPLPSRVMRPLLAVAGSVRMLRAEAMRGYYTRLLYLDGGGGQCLALAASSGG
jgi:hypothetical protein